MKNSCYLEQDNLRRETGQTLHLLSASFGIFRHLKNDQIISNIFAQQPRCASRFLAFLASETHSQISQLYKELALKIIRVIHQELLWILFAAQCVSSDRAPQIQLVYGSFQHFPMATWAYTSVQTRTRWYPPSCKLHILNPSKYYVANELDHHLYRFLSMFFVFPGISPHYLCMNNHSAVINPICAGPTHHSKWSFPKIELAVIIHVISGSTRNHPGPGG